MEALNRLIEYGRARLMGEDFLYMRKSMQNISTQK